MTSLCTCELVSIQTMRVLNIKEHGTRSNYWKCLIGQIISGNKNLKITELVEISMAGVWLWETLVTSIRSWNKIKKFKPLSTCVDLYSRTPISHINPICKPRFDVLRLFYNELSLKSIFSSNLATFLAATQARSVRPSSRFMPYQTFNERRQNNLRGRRQTFPPSTDKFPVYFILT